MTATFIDRHRDLTRSVAIAVLLGGVAALAPMPSYATDRDTYVAIGRQWIVVDCSDLHCFRVLVPWVLEHLPGPSLAKWKAYAVLCNAGAAMALARLCRLLGLSNRAAALAAWIAAFGIGSLYTLFDPYTSDPLMFLVGPVLLAMLLRDQFARSAAVAAVGVFAKEFAAAPLWIFAVYAAIGRHRGRFIRGLLAAMTVTLIWTVFQLWLTLKYNYSYAGSASTDLLGGGYLKVWASYMSPRVAASVIFAEFGALFLLIPAGLWWGSRHLRHLSLAILPAIAALTYVQQPDRALWNFHFVAIPLSVLVLEALPGLFPWLFVAGYGLANLRFGAQLTFVPAARFPVAVSLLLAAAAIGMRATRGSTAAASPITTAAS